MITNRCFEGCPHCMECSSPDGKMMDERTFHKAVMFARFLGCKVVTISGGEPTTHPDFFKFCKQLNDEYKMPFTVVSNGTWALNNWGSLNLEGTAEDMIEQCKHGDDERKKIERQIRRMCSDFKMFFGMQVYTNKKFYKNYQKIKDAKPYFDSFGGKVVFDESEIRSMQDLGRAKTCETAQKMISESAYYMSCLNSTLLAKQLSSPERYGQTLEAALLQFCHPMVDFRGNVHLSESWLCQSVGNVTKDLFYDIWNNIRLYEPCGRCKGYVKFMDSKDQKIIEARNVIYDIDS